LGNTLHGLGALCDCDHLLRGFRRDTGHAGACDLNDLSGRGGINHAIGDRGGVETGKPLCDDRVDHALGPLAREGVGDLIGRVTGTQRRKRKTGQEYPHQNVRSFGAIFLRLMPPLSSVVRGSVMIGR